MGGHRVLGYPTAESDLPDPVAVALREPQRPVRSDGDRLRSRVVSQSLPELGHLPVRSDPPDRVSLDLGEPRVPIWSFDDAERLRIESELELGDAHLRSRSEAPAAGTAYRQASTHPASTPSSALRRKKTAP